jgi:flagellar hook-associated protein 1 FlgK
MSLIGALDAGQTALAVQQAAIQVTGNNIANAGNADYTREVVNEAPSPSQQIQTGVFVGTGVDITGIQRQVDDALLNRLRQSTSDNSAAGTNQQWLGQVESVFNALSGQDLSSQLSTFFNDWSALAGNPTDVGQRQIVLQDGANVADYLQNLKSQLGGLQSSIDDQIKGQAGAANDLAQKIADLNRQIIVTEGGTAGQANGLRDQRDAVLKQLSQLMNIKTIEQPNGSVNVYVGSEMLVDGQTNRGVQVTMTPDATGASLVPSLTFKANNGLIPITSGQIGGLLDSRSQITTVSGQVDTIAHNLIGELNKIHASGQGMVGYTSITASNQVLDPTVPLNQTGAGLPYTPVNGSFVVHVTDKATGLSTSTLVKVDLDGLGGNDTTLNSLVGQLNGISGVGATVTGGVLSITSTNPGEEISFSQDTSGTLAALGINNFFTGKDASDIAVNSALTTNPQLLAAAMNGDVGDNQTALAIASLESQPLAGLGGQSLKDNYQSLINQLGDNAAAAKQNAQATQVVQDTLTNQQQALSGVSMDEEAVNLVRQQRAFQAASRVVSAVDDMMKTIIGLV